MMAGAEDPKQDSLTADGALPCSPQSVVPFLLSAFPISAFCFSNFSFSVSQHLSFSLLAYG
jgi:hypothetical protein